MSGTALANVGGGVADGARGSGTVQDHEVTLS